MILYNNIVVYKPGQLAHYKMDVFSSLLEVDLSSILVFCIIFLLTILWMFKPKSEIPGPTAWPVVGNIFSVEQFNISHKKDRFTQELAEKYGPIYQLFLGSHLVVFVNGYRNVIEVLSKRGREFVDRPSWIPGVQLAAKSVGGHLGIVWSNGEEWKSIRRFSLQSMRDFGVGKTSLEEKILEEAQNIADDLEKANGSAVQNVRDMMTKASCNVVHSIIFGYRYQHDNSRLKDLIKTMHEIFSGSDVVSATGMYPMLNFLFPTSIMQKFKAFKALKDYIDKQVLEHRESFDGNNIRDFVDIYIKEEKDSNENKLAFESGTLLTSIMDLFAAGTDTTSTTLDWSLLYMIQYTDVQEKCQQEIAKVVGSGRMVRSSDKRDLPYIEATLLEVLRLANTAPFALPHNAVCDTTINNFKIPKNTIVIASLASCHYDETIWTNPKDFNPGRFFDADNNIINKEHLLSFSIGPRFCPGESLARSELFLIFSNLLQRFTFSKVDKSDVLSFEGITGITRTAPPYRLTAKPK